MMNKTKGMIMAVMGACFTGPGLTAGTITKSATAPTDVLASGAPGAGSYTRIFGNGQRSSDSNEGRGNEIISDSGSYADGTMDALVLRKNANQDFTGTTATLTLYVFEGTKEQWDAGNGQNATDSDPFDGTGISKIHTETFALNANYLEGDYITLNLDTPVALGANMGFFVKMMKGNASHTYFEIAQQNSSGSDVDGYQYQAPSSGNFHTGSPLEYYMVGTAPPPVEITDHDDDGLANVVETNTGVFVSPGDTGTNPMLADSDGDGMSDGVEITLGSDPNNAGELPAGRPNIIFIMWDDLDIREIGVYGQKTLLTPRVDSMASQGMMFTDYYTASPVCQSCRSCLMTGQDSRRAQDRHNSSLSLHPNRVTIPEMLKQAGYTTGCVGKWGLGDPGGGSEPWKQGFDFFCGYLNQVNAHRFFPKYLWRNDQKIYFDQTLATSEGGSLYIPGAANLNQITDDWNDGFGNVCSHDVVVAEGLQFIEDNADKPFFLYCAWTPPHAYMYPAATLDALTDADGLLYDPLDLDQTLINELYPGAPFGGTPESPNYNNHCYASMVSAADRDTGRIMDKLVELGIDDKTLVIFCSDNGEDEPTFLTREHLKPGYLNYRGLKRDCYEGGIRSPFVAWWPGKVAAGSSSGVIGTFADMLPTFAEMAGLSTPAQVTGRSILPVLLGGTEDDLQPRDYHYWYFTEGTRRWRAVRQGDWKIVRNRANDGSAPTYELFNLASDPYETADQSLVETAILGRLIPLVEGTHEVTASTYFKADDEFLTWTNLTPAAYVIGAPDGTGRGNGYRLTPTGTGSCFNYLPFETGLNERATFGWTMQFPSGGTAALLLGPANAPAQCFRVQIDSASRGVTISAPGGGSASTTLPAADFPGNRAECLLTVDPSGGAGLLKIGATILPFDFSAAIGPFRFWGYEVSGAALECSRPHWTTGTSGSARARISSGAGMIAVDYSLPTLLGEESVPQYSSDLIHWFDHPPGLQNLRATGSQNGGKGMLLLPTDSLLPSQNDRLFLRVRGPR